MRFFEKRLKAALGEKGVGSGAQLEDLLIALADLRSFPETRFLVARGMVGDTWSTESVAGVAFPASVLALPVNDPERGGWGAMTVGDREVIRCGRGSLGFV